jgi:serine-type D-Ala-D-Ala carboxypeptidase
MPIDHSVLEAIVERAVPQQAPAVQLVVRWRGATVFDRCWGWLDPASCQQPVSATTRFDLASVTKLFVVAAFMRLVEGGAVALDQALASALPEFCGERPIQPYPDPQRPDMLIRLASGGSVDVGRISFRQILTHSSGLPAWRPIFRQPVPAAARQMVLATACAYLPGTNVVYSDIGLILLGMAIERLTEQPLDLFVEQQVLLPLGLRHTGYLPLGKRLHASDAIAPTGICGWRKRRIHGEVHDENAAALGGVAGHAGLFSTAAEVARFGQSFLDAGAPLLSYTSVAAMTRLQARRATIRRGLGFALWSDDPQASSHPFSSRCFGHTGFTGTSLWIDPQRSLVVALLTNDLYHGRAARAIGPLRVAIHQAIVTAIDRAAGC